MWKQRGPQLEGHGVLPVEELVPKTRLVRGLVAGSWESGQVHDARRTQNLHRGRIGDLTRQQAVPPQGKAHVHDACPSVLVPRLLPRAPRLRDAQLCRIAKPARKRVLEEVAPVLVRAVGLQGGGHDAKPLAQEFERGRVGRREGSEKGTNRGAGKNSATESPHMSNEATWAVSFPANMNFLPSSVLTLRRAA